MYNINIRIHVHICLVDAGFWFVKKNYKRTDCDCLVDLIIIVDKSAFSNLAVPQFNEDRTPEWEFRDCKSFLRGILSHSREFHPISSSEFHLKKNRYCWGSEIGKEERRFVTQMCQGPLNGSSTSSNAAWWTHS